MEKKAITIEQTFERIVEELDKLRVSYRENARLLQKSFQNTNDTEEMLDIAQEEEICIRQEEAVRRAMTTVLKVQEDIKKQLLGGKHESSQH